MFIISGCFGLLYVIVVTSGKCGRIFVGELITIPDYLGQSFREFTVAAEAGTLLDLPYL